jgi:hypothetical protein
VSGTAANIGDDELPASVGPVDVGGTVDRVAAALGKNTCVLFTTGRVRCWGFPSSIFGTGTLVPTPIGDDEPPSTGDDVQLF